MKREELAAQVYLLACALRAHQFLRCCYGKTSMNFLSVLRTGPGAHLRAFDYFSQAPSVRSQSVSV